MATTISSKKIINATRSARLAKVRLRMKNKKLKAKQLEEATVQRGTSSDGYVVYGSPAKPKHTSMEQILRAVLAVKA